MSRAAEMRSRARIDDPGIEWIDGFPMPPRRSLDLIGAARAVFRLLKDKERTHEVFEILIALSGGAGQKQFKKFLRGEYGRRVVTQPVRLEEILADRVRLAGMGTGTLGHAFHEFMGEENLTSEGLVEAASEAGIDFKAETDFEAYQRMFLHVALCHDLWHVITGYGRDALGEICVLTFTYHQSSNRGMLFIMMIGAIAQKLDNPSLPIFKVVREAWRTGASSSWIVDADIERLLAMPLDDVRREFGIRLPAAYEDVPIAQKQALLMPKSKPATASA